jgi:hypothetical protein
MGMETKSEAYWKMIDEASERKNHIIQWSLKPNIVTDAMVGIVSFADNLKVKKYEIINKIKQTSGSNSIIRGLIHLSKNGIQTAIKNHWEKQRK